MNVIGIRSSEAEILVEEGTSFVINGRFGRLTMESDGRYLYELDPQRADPLKNDEVNRFEYVVQENGVNRNGILTVRIVVDE